jgi:MFS family permease
MVQGRIPPRTEHSFRRKYMMLWVVMGAAAVAVGLIFGPRLHKWSHYSPWISIVLACALYAGSLLLCPVVLMRQWRKPETTPMVLFFAIPIGVIGVAIVLIMRSVGPNFLYVQLRELYGLYTAIGLLYTASLIWSMLVGMQRKRLGKFDIEK